MTGLRQAADQALKLGKDADLQESNSFAVYFIGVVHYLRNELAQAEQHLSDLVKDTADPELNYFHSAFALALNHQVQSRPEAAGKVAIEIISRALDSKNTKMLQAAEAFRAELALRQGNIPKAKKWTVHFDPHPFNPGHRFYVPQVTLAKVLLSLNTKSSRRRAGDLLSQLHAYYASIHNTHFLIDVLALQALLLDTRGDETAAVKKLREYAP